MDKPTFTKKIVTSTRVYFFDIHHDTKGNPYLSISELPKENCPGDRKPQRVLVHKSFVEEFAEAFNEAVSQMKKEME